MEFKFIKKKSSCSVVHKFNNSSTWSFGGCRGESRTPPPFPSSENIDKNGKITQFESGSLFWKPKMIVGTPPFENQNLWRSLRLWKTLWSLLRGAKWDTYDFVYKIDFCVDKSGFCTTKLISNYHQLTNVTFVMSEANSEDKILFCKQKSLLSWQKSFLSTKVTFVHKTKVLSRL
jgi:hypothetical protein